MIKISKLLFVVLVLSLSWQQGGAQVINSIGEENMKVEQGLKPQQKKAESPYLADIDSESPYFQYVDSAQNYIYSHDWPVAEQWLMKAFMTDPTTPVIR